MRLELDGKGHVRDQLVRALRQGITSGRCPLGMRLPPSRELASDLAVSRNTVTAAYARLVADGWLTARVGAGTFVAIQPPGVGDRSRTMQASPRLSSFSRRLLAEVDLRMIPGRTAGGVRHAFQYGAPYTNHGILDSWSKALRKAAVRTGPGYGHTQGHPELRRQVGEYLHRRRGMIASPCDVVIVGGSQQALSLCARVLVDPGDPVLIEEPHYFPVRAILNAYGARVTAVDVDDEGIRVEDLERIAPRAAFLTPNHQFPLGSVLSEERRRVLLRYASASDAWLVEDDYDGHFRNSASMPTLYASDRDGRVIHVGTFSKSLFPGVRLGYMVVPPALREAFVAAKYAEDMGASVLDQAAMAQLMADGAFDRHLLRAARELRWRRDALLKGLRRIRLPLTVSDARAGMHVLLGADHWTSADVQSIVASARSAGLGLFPAAPCYSRPPPRHSLLMGYAAMSVTGIERALAVLRDVLEAHEAIRDRVAVTG